MIPHLNLLFLASLLLVTSCDNPTETRIVNDNPIQWLLPSSLHEASGLAVAGQESVYLHNDEEGEIYRFNIRSGSIIKLASISWPPIKEDFEGIAVITGSIYMMTSDGELFEVPSSPKGQEETYDDPVPHQNCSLVIQNNVFFF